MISGTYQLSPGPTITAIWNAPNSVDRAGARPQSVGGRDRDQERPTDRAGDALRRALTQLDLRLSQALHVRPLPLRADVSLYNVFNNDLVSAINTDFSTTASNEFLRPTGVLQGRLFKIGGQLEF